MKNFSKSLSKKFLNKIEVINQDILKFINYKIFNENTVIIGNLPYNISFKFLQNLY